jgi:hypothetical protein
MLTPVLRADDGRGEIQRELQDLLEDGRGVGKPLCGNFPRMVEKRAGLSVRN